MFGQVDKGKGRTVSWRVVRSSIKVGADEDIFRWLESKVSIELVTLPSSTVVNAEDYHLLETVIVLPKEKCAFGTLSSSAKSKVPLVVYPHGNVSFYFISFFFNDSV